jgi:hypothetical protein
VALFDTNPLLSFTVQLIGVALPLKFNTCKVTTPIVQLHTFLPLLVNVVLDACGWVKSTMATSMVPSTSVSLVVTLIVRNALRW